MGRNVKPMAVQERGRRVHRANSEKEERRERESAIAGSPDKTDAPPYLSTKEQRKRHRQIVSLLQSANRNLCTDLDVDAVARYVLEEEEYLAAVKELRKARRQGCISEAVEKLQRMKNNAFKCVDTAAKSIGLTVDSRLRFNIKPEKEKPKNKFADLDG